MALGLTVTLTDAHANALTLSNYIESIDGLGMLPIQRQFRRGPGQQGSTEALVRADHRIITMRLALGNYFDSAVWTTRSNIIKCLTDLDGDLYLDCAISGGATYRLKVRYYGGLSLPTSPRDTVETSVLQLVADEPAFYLNILQTETYDYTAGWSWDHDPLTYSGTWQEYPKIEITGPCANLVLTNTTLTKKIDFTGHTITAGEVVTIDLGYEAKTVGSTGATVIGDLTNDTNLADFRIAASPEVNNGSNTFTVSWSGTNTATSKVALKYYVRYAGI